jgi:hypothetical protein
MTDEVRKGRREGLSELAEDAVGFGGQELRLTRDLILRPRAVLDAYDAHGSTAGGLYPRPLRYWLTVNGLYLLVTALLGGLERAFEPQGSIREDFASAAAKAGKTVEEFQGDLEQWYSLVSLPLYALFMGGGMFLLIRRWSPGDDRQDFRQTFTFLNGYTLWSIPIGFALLAAPSDWLLWSIPISLLVVAMEFARMGHGRWWRTTGGAWLKGAITVIMAMAALIPFTIAATALAFAGAFFAP